MNRITMSEDRRPGAATPQKLAAFSHKPTMSDGTGGLVLQAPKKNATVTLLGYMQAEMGVDPLEPWQSSSEVVSNMLDWDCGDEVVVDVAHLHIFSSAVPAILGWLTAVDYYKSVSELQSRPTGNIRTCLSRAAYTSCSFS